MENRERQNRLTLRLSDNELYILEQKCKASNMKDKSSFLRHLILYGYVYDVYKADVNEVKELMQKVWHTQKSMLSRQPSIKQ